MPEVRRPTRSGQFHVAPDKMRPQFPPRANTAQKKRPVIPVSTGEGDGFVSKVMTKSGVCVLMSVAKTTDSFRIIVCTAMDGVGVSTTNHQQNRRNRQEYGVSGIRTHETFQPTRFPIVLLRPAQTPLRALIPTQLKAFPSVGAGFIIRAFGGTVKKNLSDGESRTL